MLGSLLPLVQTFVFYAPFREAASNQGYPDKYGTGSLWQNPQSFPLTSIVVRWSFEPEPSSGMEGLAGGIAWALHPDLCQNLIPAFREENLFGGLQFTTCDSLRAAVAAAFSVWSANHRRLTFKDATDECARDGVDDLGFCRGAEVTINTFSRRTDEYSASDTAAYVQPDFTTSGATAVRWQGYSTAGVEEQMIAPRRMHLRLAEHHCWYLDETFCAFFHNNLAKSQDMPRTIIWGIFVLACLGIMRILASTATRTLGYNGLFDYLDLEVDDLPFMFCCRGGRRFPIRRRGRKRERRSTAMRWGRFLRFAADLPTFVLLWYLFWITFVPVFYGMVFLPCFECYGFLATMAHEAGHVLGFHHPENSALNLATTAGMGNATCETPSNYLRLAPGGPPGTSIMRAMAEHHSSTCLSDDDLEGLHALYPTCNDAAVARRPVCTKVVRTTGYLRLFLAMIIPYSVVTLLLLALQTLVRRLLRAHENRLLASIDRRANQGRWLRASCRAVWANAGKIGAANPTAPESSANPSAANARLSKRYRRRVYSGMGAAGLVKGAFGALTPRLTPRARAPQAVSPSPPRASPRRNLAARAAARNPAPRNAAAKPNSRTPVALPPSAPQTCPAPPQAQAPASRTTERVAHAAALFASGFGPRRPTATTATATAAVAGSCNTAQRVVPPLKPPKEKPFVATGDGRVDEGTGSSSSSSAAPSAHNVHEGRVAEASSVRQQTPVLARRVVSRPSAVRSPEESVSAMAATLEGLDSREGRGQHRKPIVARRVERRLTPPPGQRAGRRVPFGGVPAALRPSRAEAMPSPVVV